VNPPTTFFFGTSSFFVSIFSIFSFTIFFSLGLISSLGLTSVVFFGAFLISGTSFLMSSCFLPQGPLSASLPGTILEVTGYSVFVGISGLLSLFIHGLLAILSATLGYSSIGLVTKIGYSSTIFFGGTSSLD